MRTILALALCLTASAHADTLVANYDGKLYTYTGSFTGLEMQGLNGVAEFSIASRVVVPAADPAPPVTGSWQITLSGNKVYFLECFATYSLNNGSLDLVCRDDEG